MKGDVPTITDGRILGHEGVGIIEDVGTNVLSFHKGDKVLISPGGHIANVGVHGKPVELHLEKL
jgi:D-arabinose 1-dehydrogenase-like Zn-dependent alcohol dehydrogenase